MLVLLASGAQAADVCPAPPPAPPELAPPRPVEDQRLHLDAARTETHADGSATFEGDVRAVQGPRSFRADRLEYDHVAGTVRASGHLVYRDPRLTLIGDRADVDMTSDVGRFSFVDFQFNDRLGRGHADELKMIDAQRSDLTKVQFTGCPKGDDSWTFDAATMHIDRSSGLGKAEDVLVRFKGVPLFYTPKLSFPVDDRRLTGLLPPRIGASERHGTELSLPWYWNIAPDMDATVVFHPMTKRGLMLENEYRYLGQSYGGTVEFDALAHDAETGESRGRARVTHRNELSAAWSLDLDLAAVSDPTYFEDFGSSLVATTQVFLPRRIDLLSSGLHYAFRARLLDYQTTDPTLTPADEPYGKLPQLALVAATEQGKYGVTWDVAAELVRFQHDSLVQGTRLDLKPRVSLPLRGDGWFMTPALAWRYSQWELDSDPAFADSISREMPIASFDAGLLFERDTGGGKVQTLEPRIYYLKVPFRDQTGIPLFDTAIPDVRFEQLFRDNRYIGADRQGDADQLSLALTSRLLDPDDGRTVLEGSIGQISYFEDRTVTLTATPETLSRSELIAQVASDLTAQLSVAATAVFEPGEGQTQRSNVSLRWRPEARKRLDFSYRFRQASVEQTDLALVWPLSSRWRAIARWNYSLLDKDSLETLGGLEYESCCWALRFGAREYIFNRTGETDRTVFLQLELKGLARVGERFEELLDRGTSNHGIPETL
jgi:LPS-assembly protein